MTIKMMLIPLAVLLTACQSTLVPQPDLSQTVKGQQTKAQPQIKTSIFTYSFDPEIKYYLEQYNISIKEAERRLFISSNRDAAFEALQKEFSGHIAGSYIENEPTYKYVMRMVGTGKDNTRLVKIYDRNNSSKYEVLPVEIKYGARFTKEASLLQRDEAAKLVSRYFSKPRMTGYDKEKDIIVADVHGKPTPENLAFVKKVQSEWGQDKLPLIIEFVSYSIVPL